MASHTYTDSHGNGITLYTDSNGNVTHHERAGESGGERVNRGDEVSHSPNTERVGESIDPNVERHWGLPVDSAGIQWMDNAAALSVYGFALMGGTHLASKTPLGGLALFGFIGGTVCLVTSIVMYLLAPIPLVASWIANR